ncbi:TPA: hypothetical protein U0K61_001474 [Streptococcus suis]|nr:hypothetical protein [Streptococcus suis]
MSNELILQKETEAQTELGFVLLKVTKIQSSFSDTVWLAGGQLFARRLKNN